MAERPGPDPLERWRPVAEDLVWDTPYTALHRAVPPLDEWFVGGRLNLSVNCLDRHLDAAADRVAVFWEGEPGDRRELTYRQLHDEVVRLSAALRQHGVGPGDRVALHLGWLPETVAAMLACARIGAEFTVVPVALPVEALALRLGDYRPKVLFTQDGGWRHGSILPLKARADEALEATSGVELTVVVRRSGVAVDWFAGDRWYDDVLAAVDAPDGAVPDGGAVREGTATVPDGAPASLPADHPVVAVHLANRRGRPVAVRHGAANLAASALAVHRYGLAAGEVYWCAADLSWLGAQAHGVFGPLLAGHSAVMFEGTLDVPDSSRAWRILERYRVSSLIAPPSVVRTLRRWSLDAPAESTGWLRRMTTAGDRLDPELRSWLTSVLGPDVVVADGWGQVELGGVVVLDQPADPDRLPDPGFVILDEAGSPVPDGEVGEWATRAPWAGTLRAVSAHGEDPIGSHWTRHPGHYATGDLARRSPDGVQFLGRLDEVVSVSGQLVSLNEVRQVLVDQPFVGDAEVFERPDPRLGRAVAAAVVLAPGVEADLAGLRELQDWVREQLGGLSRPRTLVVVDRFGPELTGNDLRRALARLSYPVDDEPAHLTWEQVVAAAGA